MRTKIVEVEGNNYQLRKMSADVGSFIYYRLLGVVLDLAAKQQQQNPEVVAPESTPTMSAEEKTRWLCTTAIMRLDFEDLKFTNRQSLQVVSKELLGNEGTFIPIMQDTGRWVDQDIAEDVPLTQRLVLESLMFSLGGFFYASGDLKATNPAATSQ